MPRYYFAIRHNGIVIPDVEGEVFPDVRAAVRHARQTAAEIWRESLPLNGHRSVVFVDTHTLEGKRLKTVNFGPAENESSGSTPET